MRLPRRKPGYYFSKESPHFYETIWMILPNGEVQYLDHHSLEWELVSSREEVSSLQDFWSKGRYEFISKL